ncbi:MAG: hypothetical protein V1664_00255 [Candidatus Uhrbacteria bacterium]
MTKFQKILPWLCCLILLLAGSIFFVYQQQSCSTKDSVTITEAESTVSEIAITNCQKSGGSYSKSENICVCSIEYDEQLKYDSDTGYCMSAFGTPGGELGETARKLQAFEILSNENQSELLGPISYNCKLSGGEFVDSVCVCPIEEQLGQTQEMMYDKNSGFCQTTHGGSGGDAFAAGSGLPWGHYGYYNDIVDYWCDESGGSKSGAACLCTSGENYNKTTGRCE